MHRAGEWGGCGGHMCFRGALWSMCSGWLGLITGGQFELGISVRNRRGGGGEGRGGGGGSGVQRPPSRWNKRTFVEGAHYSMRFTLGHQISVVPFTSGERSDGETTVSVTKVWDAFLHLTVKSWVRLMNSSSSPLCVNPQWEEVETALGYIKLSKC